MELVLDKPIISVSIIKEISSLYGFMYMFTHSVPPSTPTILLIPVINEARRQVSMNISINVRERITCLMQTMSECKKIIMHNNYHIALYFGSALFW